MLLDFVFLGSGHIYSGIHEPFRLSRIFKTGEQKDTNLFRMVCESLFIIRSLTTMDGSMAGIHTFYWITGFRLKKVLFMLLFGSFEINYLDRRLFFDYPQTKISIFLSDIFIFGFLFEFIAIRIYYT